MKSNIFVNFNSHQIQQTSWSASSHESDTAKRELESLFSENNVMTHSSLYTQPDQRSLSVMTHDAAKYLDLFHGHCTFEGPYTITSNLFNFINNAQLTDVRKCQIMHHLNENGIDMIELVNSPSGFPIKSFILGLDFESLEGRVTSPLKYIQDINGIFYFALGHNSVILTNHLLSMFKPSTEIEYNILEKYIREAMYREKSKIAEILLEEYIAKPDNIHVKFYIDIYCESIKYRMFNIKSMAGPMLRHILTQKPRHPNFERIKNLLDLGVEGIPFTHLQVKATPHLYCAKRWSSLRKNAHDLEYVKQWISEISAYDYFTEHDLISTLILYGSDEVISWYLIDNISYIYPSYIKMILERGGDVGGALEHIFKRQPFDFILAAYSLKLRNLVKHILTTVKSDTTYGGKELFTIRMVCYNDIEMLRLIPMNQDEVECALRHSLICGHYDIYMYLRRCLHSDHVFSEYVPEWTKAAKDKGFFELASLPPAPPLQLRARM